MNDEGREVSVIIVLIALIASLVLVAFQLFGPLAGTPWYLAWSPILIVIGLDIIMYIIKFIAWVVIAIIPVKDTYPSNPSTAKYFDKKYKGIDPKDDPLERHLRT